MNATTVDEILASLETDCAAKYPRQPGKKSFCDEVAEVFVQIPPGLFEGLETLAWPIPLGVCATAGKCQTVCCAEGNSPEQVHLSLSGFGDTSRMGVAWVDLAGAGSVVEYSGPWVNDPDHDDDPATVTVSGDTTTYPAGDAGWGAGVAPQGAWVGTVHRALMTGLEAGSTYKYRVSAGGAGDPFSEWFTFNTLPAAEAFEADPTLSLNFAIVGDMDYAEKSDATVANMESLVDAGLLDVVVHSGDVSYADGFMPHWDVFMNKVQPVASRVPYMVTPGNHEIWYNFSAYKHRFLMPSVGPNFVPGWTSGSGDNMYYEWGVGGLVHFNALDSETSLDTANFGDEQVGRKLAEILPSRGRIKAPTLLLLGPNDLPPALGPLEARAICFSLPLPLSAFELPRPAFLFFISPRCVFSRWRGWMRASRTSTAARRRGAWPTSTARSSAATMGSARTQTAWRASSGLRPRLSSRKTR